MSYTVSNKRERIGTTVIQANTTVDTPLSVRNADNVDIFTISNAGVVTQNGNVVSNTLTETVQIIGASAATSTNYRNFFIADRAYTVAGISEIHATAGSDGSAVTLIVEKCTGTQASGSGVTLQSANIDLKATANTVQSPALTATAADLVLAAGNRLGLVLTGTPTAVANVVVTVQLKAS